MEHLTAHFVQMKPIERNRIDLGEAVESFLRRVIVKRCVGSASILAIFVIFRSDFVSPLNTEANQGQRIVKAAMGSSTASTLQSIVNVYPEVSNCLLGEDLRALMSQ